MIYDNNCILRALEDGFTRGWWESKRKANREEALKEFMDECKQRLGLPTSKDDPPRRQTEPSGKP